jgi:hypothetical protein
MEKINCVFDDKDFGFSKGSAKFQSDEIFKDYKPMKDANKRFNAIAEENAKRAVQEMDPFKDTHAKRMGKLFMTGSDSDMVKHDIARREHEIAAKKKAKKQHTIASDFPIVEGHQTDDEPVVKSPSQRIFSPTRSLEYSTKSKYAYPPPVQSSVLYNPHSNQSWDKPYHSHASSTATPTMRSSSAMHYMERVPGGKYHVTSTLDPYMEKFRVSEDTRPHNALLI